MAKQHVYFPKVRKKERKRKKKKKRKQTAIRRIDWGENIKWMFLHKKTQADNISAL